MVQYFMSVLEQKAHLMKDTFQGKVEYPILAMLIYQIQTSTLSNEPQAAQF
jgi:hypothetical protein